MVRRGGGDVTIRTHLDRSWVWGRGVSDVKNYHITASNSALESPSAAKFNALMFKLIEKLQKGGR